MKVPQICSYLLSIAPLVVAHGLHHNKDYGLEAKHEFKQNSVVLKQESIFYSLVCLLQDHVFVMGPRYNAIVAILIIQFMPCLFVLLVPGLRRNDPSSLTLSLLVSFSLGTLLGDILLHVVPESLSGVSDPTVVGAAIFLGFISFLALDKTMRILSGTSSDDGGIHSHSHSHTPQHQEAEKKMGFNMSAYLNVISGIAHHITDGIALAASFYGSTQVGIMTSIAVTFHEIPHELGDFAILLSSGFTYPQAIRAQAVTAFGAVVGTAIGCWINEIGNASNKGTSSSAGASELMLPFTAGGLIYIATTSVVPQILHSSAPHGKLQEFKKWTLQLVSIFVGFAVMALMDEH
ncbi:Zn(2+) transporter YKE4 [Saccharomyces paradoxus]|uniref:Zn(2+) transporter YKE4 n=1 Tax=Saccharomyces paradoxus TaxID=27291 RepID=A0A8B8UTG7_SACPA|nr:Yke4 [Saccharomyces paradoxus]QHS73986.1 Yke4 [Saccharomyces paradoxus]